MNIKNDLKLLSLISFAVSLLMVIPMLIAIVCAERTALVSFLLSFSVAFTISVLLYLVSRGSTSNSIGIRDGYFFVTFTWILATALGSLPLFFAGMGLDYSSCFFEIMSGFTTTGATVFADVESLPYSVLFWRSFTNWLGGMGIVVLFVALVPSLGAGGTKFYSSETVGPSKDKLTPKSRNTAMILWYSYIGMTILQILFLICGGNGIFDAVTVTFSTVSTAGFSSQNASIGAFGGYTQTVAAVFMFLAGVNFSLYYRMVFDGPKAVFQDAEFKIYAAIVFCSSLVMSVSLLVSGIYPDFFTSFHNSFFQFVSMMTTTGFSTANYRQWPVFSQMVLFLAMFIGGCAGSTGGGVKVIRISVIVRSFSNSLRGLVHPKGVFPLTFNGSPVSEKSYSSIAAFLMVYFMFFFGGAILLPLVSPNVKDMTTAISASILCLGNIGMGFGDTSVFAPYSAAGKVLLSFLMLVGRLEIFTVLSIFSRSFWKK